MGAHGVKPMNCPRRLFLRPIHMRCESRHNQELACSNLVSATLELTPAGAFGAIDKDGLRSAPFTRAGVPLGFWIIASIGRHEIPKERIFHSFFENRTWHHDDALPSEALMFLAPFHSAKTKNLCAKW